MNIYIITENNYLFTGLELSLSSKMNSQFIQLNPHDKRNNSTYEGSDPGDIYILAPESSKLDFSMLVALNDTRSSVIIASNYSEWNVGRIFRFSTIARVFYLSDLLQCIFTLRPSKNKNITLPKITSNEKNVLLMTLNGVSINYIGPQLNITTKTAYAHQRNALKKLGVRKIRDIVSLPDHFIEYVCDHI